MATGRVARPQRGATRASGPGGTGTDQRGGDADQNRNIAQTSHPTSVLGSYAPQPSPRGGFARDRGPKAAEKLLAQAGFEGADVAPALLAVRPRAPTLIGGDALRGGGA